MKINENYLKIEDSYLSSTIAKKVKEFQKNNPNKKIIDLGIGDVTRSVVPAVIDAMHKAIDEMSEKESFKGYGLEQEYDFLKSKILENDYEKRGIKIQKDEVFISNGAKCDTGNIGEIFSKDNVVAITDPVYLDTNIMSERNKIVYLPATAENNFVPELPNEKVDIIYLCVPNNPTGTVLTREQLKKWVDYAINNEAIILYDTAYEAFITDENVPHSIYEIEGAKKVAIEFRSFSKTAGFTRIRCAYTVVPKELVGYTEDEREISLNSLWNGRQSTKFNGVSYVTQKAAEAVYSEDGQIQIKENIEYYLENARIIREGLLNAGFTVYGGKNAPYIWLKVPKGHTSWSFFDELLEKVAVVGTPGGGFGKVGEGYLRLTAFGDRANTIEAIQRIVMLSRG